MKRKLVGILIMAILLSSIGTNFNYSKRAYASNINSNSRVKNEEKNN